MMKLPTQAEPVARCVTSDKRPRQDGVEPQQCWCMNPNGTGYTWWCEVDRELLNTQQAC